MSLYLWIHETSWSYEYFLGAEAQPNVTEPSLPSQRAKERKLYCWGHDIYESGRQAFHCKTTYNMIHGFSRWFHSDQIVIKHWKVNFLMLQESRPSTSCAINDMHSSAEKFSGRACSYGNGENTSNHTVPSSTGLHFRCSWK